MALNRAIDITSDQWRKLISLFSGHLPNGESRMCGLRVRGTSRPESDLDVVVFAAPDQDEPGFRRSATLEAIREHIHVLTPGRYVGAGESEEVGTPFDERFTELKRLPTVQFAEADELGIPILNALEEVGEHG